RQDRAGNWRENLQVFQVGFNALELSLARFDVRFGSGDLLFEFIDLTLQSEPFRFPDGRIVQLCPCSLESRWCGRDLLPAGGRRGLRYFQLRGVLVDNLR